MSLQAEAPAAPLPANRSVARIMALVLCALLPGVLARSWQSGAGFVWQLVLALGIGLAVEASMLRLRRQPLRPFLGDGSALVAAALLALLLPVPTPWWMIAVAMGFAMAVAKHLFGGLGHNLFNPAMAGYALLLVAFAAHFQSGAEGGPWWLAACYLLGGAFLLWKKIIHWQAPLAMLAGATLVEFACSVATETAIAAPGPALFLTAFFIVTDPVTGCTTGKGKFLFGAGVGVFSVLFARWGGLADGLPFAVLLLNFAAPWLEQRTLPARQLVGTGA